MNSFRSESIHSSDYINRTPEYYLNSIDPSIRNTFSPEQSEAILSILETAIPKPSAKIVDLRFNVDLLLARFYVVLFVGKDRRRKRRTYMPDRLVQIGNAIAATLLLLGLNLLITLFIFLLLYLIKSAIGIDIFQGEHFSDQLKKGVDLF